MILALIQFDPVVGDIQGNAARASREARAAIAQGASVVVFPELALCGYPPRDLLLREGLAEACSAALEELARECAGAGASASGGASASAGANAGAATIIIGSPRAVHGGTRPLANSVAVLQGGRVAAWYDKRLLPTYDVFDEHRYFAAGAKPLVIDVERGERGGGGGGGGGSGGSGGGSGGNGGGGSRAQVGIVVCEDLWQAHDVSARATYGADPLADTAASKPAMIVALSASPFVRGKHARHMAMLADAAGRAGTPIVSVNQFGSYDDLVFDGDVRVVWPDGHRVESNRWQAGCLLVDMAKRERVQDASSASATAPAAHDLPDLWQALVCGTRGYLARTGHGKAIVGISGGIDSALVAAIGVAALGPTNVLGVLMPSRWSSAGSVSDALDLANRLGIETITLPIGEAHAQLERAVGDELKRSGRSGVHGLTDENIQSRLRGLQVMAVSNATGALVLTTGNKSEYAVGYTTLYGDMNGGLAPIGDVLKTEVWRLARWVNEHFATCGFAKPPIPDASILKVPSAELRADQTDQDTLPPYDQLDAIVRAWVEEERSEAETVRATGLPAELVRKWTTAIDRAEYKRYQAAVMIKVSARAFGRGRRMPLAARWRTS